MYYRTRPVFEDLRPQYGFHDMEKDILGPFVWTKRHFGVRFPGGNSVYAVRMCYYGQNGKLFIGQKGRARKEMRLYQGWNTYPLELEGFGSGDVEFEVNPVIQITGDSRELGLMVRRIRKPGQDCSPADIRKVLVNKAKNQEEFAQGRAVLESYPRILRISVESRCNIRPPCVYCHWDRARSDESTSDFRFFPAVLRKMGAFYRCAEEIGELGHGEPMLHPGFLQLIEDLDASGKAFSFASNGQLLGRLDWKKLMGKDLEMYVSIDSASAEGYARYRNERFGPLIRDLGRLCKEKKRRSGFPAVIASFIAMRSNLSEFEDFLDLMKAVGADGVRVMNLDRYPDSVPKARERNGFRFIYENERLSFAELNDFILAARSAARRKSVHFSAVMDFGGEVSSGNSFPVCTEPWKSINVLNRGLTLCCNNKIEAVAGWSERKDRTLEQFLSDVWNGERYRKIREDLASGRFPGICRRAGSCPIVRRKTEDGAPGR